jgi:uncharacterized protein YjbI with pentapeptide repeats
MGGINLLDSIELIKADSHRVNLQGIDLRKADLTDANLDKALVTYSQLTKTKTLQKVTLPNGMKYETG